MATENEARGDRLKALMSKLMDGLAHGVTEEFGVELTPQDLMIVDPEVLRMSIAGARIVKVGLSNGGGDETHEVFVKLVEHIIFLERQLGRMPDA